MRIVIKEAKQEQNTEIYELWKSAYPTRSKDYLDFYFAYIFDHGSCIFLPQDDKIISSLQMNAHVLKFHGRYLQCTYIFGVATLPDYRRRGHMHYLMDAALDEISHNHLITFVEAFNPKLYAPYGFETIYDAKTYHINTRYFEKVNTKGVSHQFTSIDLYDLFQIYEKHFGCCYRRSEAYYEQFVIRNTIDHRDICVYRNKHQEICGYAVYTKNDVEVKVSEIVYLDSIALMKLLRYISDGYPDIQVSVSQSEKLEKLFPLTIPKKTGMTMARINNYELFNKLFNCSVHTPKEAFAILNKPIFLPEKY